MSSLSVCFIVIGTPPDTTAPKKKKKATLPPKRWICKDTFSPTSTIHELYQYVHTHLHTESTSSVAKSSQQDYTFTLWYNFPLQSIDNSKASSTSELQTLGIKNQERITIRYNNNIANSTTKKQSSIATAATTETTETTETTTTTTTGRRTSKRKAAIAATESFPAVIAAQEQLSAATKPSAKRKQQCTKKRNGSTTSYFTKLERQQQTNDDETNGSVSMSSPRRLKDGKTIQNPVVQRQRRLKLQQASAGTTTTEESLMNGLALSGSNSKHGSLMRKNWKSAVNSVYEINQAAARLGTNPYNGLDLRRCDSNLIVSYSKGIQGSGGGMYVDTEQYLSYELLEATVRSIYNSSSSDSDTNAGPESLRPMNTAVLSPRVLWSLVYWYLNTTASTANTTTTTVGELCCTALQELCSDLNWNFLRRRKQQLSTKALENKRQEESNDNETSNYEAAAAIIQSVEDSMNTMMTSTSSTTDIAVEEPVIDGTGSTWTIHTPTEEDLDELMECINSSSQQDDEDSTAVLSIQQILQVFVQKCYIHNWRELANVITVDDILQPLLGTLNDDETTIGTRETVMISKHAVSCWITYAQERTLDEIVYEICDGNADAIEVLMTHGSICAPADMELWCTIPHILHQQLRDGVAATTEESSSTTNGTTEVPSIDTLRNWCYRGKYSVEQLPWLSLFTTPIV